MCLGTGRRRISVTDWRPLVYQGLEITFAVTEDHHVYVWGSMGLGPTGNSEKIPEDEEPDASYNEPRRVDYLKV